MATTQEREDFKEIMSNVINIVQGQTEISQAEGKNVEYKGIWSIADYMARYYMENYYDTKECEYLIYKKEQMLVLDLAYYLSRNWNKFMPDSESEEKGKIKSFDFRAVLKKIDKDLLDWKKKIFQQWISGDLHREFVNCVKNNVNLVSEERKLRYQFCKEFRHFQSSRLNEFKKALGLKDDDKLLYHGCNVVPCKTGVNE